MIAVIDYGMGNLRSVHKALVHLGAKARIVRDPDALAEARAMILPGVGAFRDCMENLRGRGLAEALVQEIRSGKPYLGICLGLQVLFSESLEFGRCPGLGLIPGRVRRFAFEPGTEAARLKIPHMGWNSIRKLRPVPLLADVADGAYFYFVHSYYVEPEDTSVVAAVTEYGVPFPSMIWRDNLFAVQFHPEKSGPAGLAILRTMLRQ